MSPVLLYRPACSHPAQANPLVIEVEKALGVAPPETLSIDPERPLYEACRRMLSSRARRIPLVSYDSQTDRSLVVSVITQYRILKFVAVNVGETQKLRKPLKDLNLGTYNDVVTASMSTPVIDVIHKLMERSISSVPIISSDRKLLIFEIPQQQANIPRCCSQCFRGSRRYHIN